ncbi:putative Sequence-specific DNA binding transcription factor [Hibiscus syriacus]|uniref:Sequence-specific DNA binding transcription factor n=1 Tax=Hibiscus syriacus TaxID=106335 RepID=A0A6A2WA71_HIBSY|nr:putative Sequence-specific DNA binding transcription factor [Hibiscus syriacus]
MSSSHIRLTTMEGKPPVGGDMLQGWVYGCLDLQDPVQLQHKQKPRMSQQASAFGLAENETRKSIVIENDMSNYAEQSKLEHNEAGNSEDGSPWQRMKWTGKSVKLLVTILSYIGEDPPTDCVGSQIKMSSLLKKQGKWKCVSKVMADWDYHVSSTM